MVRTGARVRAGWGPWLGLGLGLWRFRSVAKLAATFHNTFLPPQPLPDNNLYGIVLGKNKVRKKL